MTQVVQKIKKEEVSKQEELKGKLWHMIEDLEEEEKFINRKKTEVVNVYVYLRDNNLATNHYNMLDNLMSSMWSAKTSKNLKFYQQQFHNLTTEIEDAKDKGYYNY